MICQAKPSTEHTGLNFSAYCIFRIVVQHMEEFQDQKRMIQAHVPNKYSAEMGSKSEVVSFSVVFIAESE